MVSSMSALSARRWGSVLLATLLGLGGAMSALAASDTVALPEVVATVQGQPIKAEELQAAAQSDLVRLEMQRYEAMKKHLDALIAERIVAMEAAKRGISVQQFEQEEILAKVTPITPEMVKQFYEGNKERIRQPLDHIEARLTDYLQKESQRRRQEELFRELMQRYQVTVALQPPTVPVVAEGNPFKGPKDALVTVIEFSDFQCPYCRSVQPTLQRLMQEYDGKVKLVFRDFPLRQAHPLAQKAAEAAQCAAEQEKFWSYHDKLFTVSSLQVDDLKKYAQEMGLKADQFNACLDSSKYAGEIEKDLQEGQNAGVSATPSFFINGLPVSGAVPYERFKEMVEVALKQGQASKSAN